LAYGSTRSGSTRFSRRASCVFLLCTGEALPYLHVTRAFYAFRDSPQRRRALRAEPGAPERYMLFGLDELRSRGHDVEHNLERDAPPLWARVAGGVVKRGLERAGGYGGDFATVLGSLGPANRADVVFSTVDTVGIPLVLARWAGALRRPLVYAAIGLPERLVQLRSERIRDLYAQALAGCASILAYSEREARDLEAWLAERGRRVPVSFVPFGVEADAFRPSAEPATRDVVSVGADPHRDLPLLLEVARSLPETRFSVVAGRDNAPPPRDVPANVSVEVDLPFDEMKRRLQDARVVALPVRENTYSGATTVLLQAMALGKPVVVSRTGAIASGYELVDGENCRLVPPGDADAFARSLRDVLGGDSQARALGANARATVERSLTWDRYVDRIEAALAAAAAVARAGSPPS
jgi:glycosyltransferase involved in cell wall biosynthesis